MARRRLAPLGAIATLVSIIAGPSPSSAGDAAAGRIVFESRCHGCHAAPPYIGRIGEANLPLFLANPRRYNPNTAMTFPGLRTKKEIDDVIAFIPQH